MTLSPHELTGSFHDEPTQRPWRDWLAEHIGLDDEQKQGVYGSIARSATLRDATMGLVLGSPAVIIGAMLISPLMGPIMAAGLALAAGDLVLVTLVGVIFIPVAELGRLPRVSDADR